MHYGVFKCVRFCIQDQKSIDRFASTCTTVSEAFEFSSVHTKPLAVVAVAVAVEVVAVEVVVDLIKLNKLVTLCYL